MQGDPAEHPDPWNAALDGERRNVPYQEFAPARGQDLQLLRAEPRLRVIVHVLDPLGELCAAVPHLH